MMLRVGSPASRRAALLAFFAVTALALLLSLFAAASIFARNYHRASELRDRATRYERVVARQRMASKDLADLAQVSEVKSYFVSAPNAAAAAAQVQQHINGYSSLRALSVQKLAAAPSATGSGEVSVEIALIGDLADVARFLIELRAARPKLLLETMTVTRLPRPAAARQMPGGTQAVGLALTLSALSNEAAAE